MKKKLFEETFTLNLSQSLEDKVTPRPVTLGEKSLEEIVAWVDINFKRPSNEEEIVRGDSHSWASHP